jgi:hypothetical protein
MEDLLSQSIIRIHLGIYTKLRGSIWSINERWIRRSSCDLRFACREKRRINQIANVFDVRPDCKVFRGIDHKLSSSSIRRSRAYFAPFERLNAQIGSQKKSVDAPFLLVDCTSLKIATHWKMMWCAVWWCKFCSNLINNGLMKCGWFNWHRWYS